MSPLRPVNGDKIWLGSEILESQFQWGYHAARMRLITSLKVKRVEPKASHHQLAS